MGSIVLKHHRPEPEPLLNVSSSTKQRSKILHCQGDLMDLLDDQIYGGIPSLTQWIYLLYK